MVLIFTDIMSVLIEFILLVQQLINLEQIY
jgi:hypothetical protein